MGEKKGPILRGERKSVVPGTVQRSLLLASTFLSPSFSWFPDSKALRLRAPPSLQARCRPRSRPWGTKRRLREIPSAPASPDGRLGGLQSWGWMSQGAVGTQPQAGPGTGLCAGCAPQLPSYPTASSSRCLEFVVFINHLYLKINTCS